jgi:hypothetical protein
MEYLCACETLIFDPFERHAQDTIHVRENIAEELARSVCISPEMISVTVVLIAAVFTVLKFVHNFSIFNYFLSISLLENLYPSNIKILTWTDIGISFH